MPIGRSRPGLAGIDRNKNKNEAFKKKAEEVTEMTASNMMEQMTTFKEKLEEYAKKHKKEINKNPELRHHFHQMCAKIGVDPLASKKGFWGHLLGFHDFYYELAIQAIEVCMRSRRENGGLMPLNQVTAGVQRKRAVHSQKISADDVEEALTKVCNRSQCWVKGSRSWSGTFHTKEG
eukprot:TRINITY_DN67851_c6_g1_i2.p1 TRINITY_DN67851_c6_g1~~TRINITY_DN67851_c6_g1_i2.p1  ORF type:complete len:177 (+),score=22.45 TRINITY_DN67851_c6_g1_i2:61-591(+)